VFPRILDVANIGGDTETFRRFGHSYGPHNYSLAYTTYILELTGNLLGLM